MIITGLNCLASYASDHPDNHPHHDQLYSSLHQHPHHCFQTYVTFVCQVISWTKILIPLT